uniref:Uncharacterized protein n=1 Tax=Leptobrachium leishanense TaxID=445787 RepID=A0A8C5Q146_9ANUR
MEDGKHNKPDPDKQDTDMQSLPDAAKGFESDDGSLVIITDEDVLLADKLKEEEEAVLRDNKVRNAVVVAEPGGNLAAQSFMCIPNSWHFPWWTTRTVVGIFSDSVGDCKWLANLLRSDVFTGHVSEVKVYRKPEDLKQDVSSLSRVIIYKSGGHSDDQSDLYHLLTELRKQRPDYALKNVRIVVGDLDNIESAKSNTATRESCQEPILYTKRDIKLFKESKQLIHRAKEKLKQIVTIMTPSQGWNPWNLLVSPTTHTVGIFSRDSEENYQWLMDCEEIKRAASTVTACFVSSSGFRQFHQDVSQCSFGILYHTKNRGRVNVTDVTDALYNDELRYLSDKLGKENVIVVVDDVDQDTSELKQKILENQPSISAFARELFMFNREGKAVLEKVRVMESWIKYGESLEDKVAGKAESAP